MINSLRLQNYRSYTDASFEFGSKVNIIVGPNGSGKTNLLEAIQVVAAGSSYRVNDNELLNFAAPWFRLDATIDDGTHSRVVKYDTTKRQPKSFVFDDKSFLRLTQTHTLPIVLFEPNHLQLLHGTPELRRNFLDVILIQIKPGYSSFLKNYRRVLSQRNALLKRGHASTAELFPWNLRISELGAVISRARNELIAGLQPKLAELYKILAKSTVEVDVTYTQQFSAETYETSLLHQLESSLEKEIARGFTAYGPHREDFVVTMNGKRADEVASRGETRTIVLALKILELELIEQTLGKTPILLLDDVFSELDGSRRRALTDYLETHQTFLTTTDADIVVKHFTSSTIIPLG